MFVKYFKEYSYNLDREMEFKVYGHAGKPCVVFPCQDGQFYDFEDRGMIDTIADKIEQGRIQLFCIQCADKESWSDTWGDQHKRILIHEQWFNYVCEEFIPRLYQIHNETAQEDYQGKVMTTGASMGAYHSLNFLLRRPDIFDTTLCLSGLYHASYFFQNYNDPLIYHNSPTDYLSQMDPYHPYVEKYRHCDIIICCGQGAWEEESCKDGNLLREQFARLNVPVWIDFWGYDVCHDWPWWLKQFPYFIDKLV